MASKRISDASVSVATGLTGGYVSLWDKAGNTTAETATTQLVARELAKNETVDWTGGATGAVARTAVAKAGDVVSVRDFGALGDGSTDDTAAINAAVATGKPVLFPFATYITVGGHNLTVDGQAIFLQGSTLKVKNGTIVSGATAGWIFQVTAANVSIVNGVLDGNRANRTPADVANVTLITCYGAKNPYFADLVVKNGVCDALLLDGTSKSTDDTNFTSGALVVGCVFDNSYRNNVSVVGAQYWTFISCKFTNANGTAPQDGIDVEPDPGDITGGNRCGKLVSCHAEGNHGFGYGMTSVAGCKDHVLVGCTSRANLTGAIQGGTVGLQVLGGAHEDYAISTQTGGTMPGARGVIDVGSGAGRSRFTGVTLRNVKGGTAAVYVHGGAAAAAFVDPRIEIDSTAAAGFWGMYLSGPDVSVDRGQIVGNSSTQVHVYLSGARPRITGGVFEVCALASVYVDSTVTDAELDDIVFKEIVATSGNAVVYLNTGAAVRRLTRMRMIKASSDASVPFFLTGSAVSESWGHVIDATHTGAATPNIVPWGSPVAATGSSFTPNGLAGTTFQYTLNAAATVNAPANLTAGQLYVFQYIQDGTGGRTLTYNAAWKAGTATATVTATGNTAGKVATDLFLATSATGAVRVGPAPAWA